MVKSENISKWKTSCSKCNKNLVYPGSNPATATA